MKPTPLTSILVQLGNPSISKDTSTVVTGVQVDSRLIKPGELFFALEGGKVDGHQYIADAAAKGASGVVVRNSYQGADHGLPLIRVADPLKTLHEWAKSTLKSSKAKVVAVTGSIGKTTTKEFITTLLKEKYSVTSTPGNSNSQTSTPLVILNLFCGDEDVIVLEMGMTHPGQIAALVNIAPPDVAVLTTVALVHACNFPSLGDIARAKAEIFSHPKTTTGILSYDIANFNELLHIGSCRKVSFSTKSHDADYFLREVADGLQIYSPQGKAHLPSLDLPGKHNQHNLLAAIAVARSMDLQWEEIASGIPKLKLFERRLEFVEKQGVLFVNDSYNANAVSIKAALDTLPAPKNGGKKIAVIGEMLELGKFTEECHMEVAEAALEHVDSMICMGANCKTIVERWNAAKRPVIWKMNIEDVVAELQKQTKPGDVVLLKGSRANGLWRVLPAYD